MRLGASLSTPASGAGTEVAADGSWLVETIMYGACRYTDLSPCNVSTGAMPSFPMRLGTSLLTSAADAGTEVAADGSWLVEMIVHGTCQCTCLSPGNVGTGAMGCARDGGFRKGKIPARPSRRRASTSA